MPPIPPNSETQMRLNALSVGLRQQNICVLRQSADHRFELTENVPSDWPQATLAGGTESDVLPAGVAVEFAAAFDRSRFTGETQVLEFGTGEGLRHRQFQASLLPDAAGVTTVVTDITDQLTRERAVSTLLREVSHRSKNLLAIVQSVAMQTAYHSGSIQAFLDKFRGRLHALSSTQDLVTESDWRGTYLQPLIASQLARVGTALVTNVKVSGANPLLGPNASLHIGLALHELGANAMLHGALANGQRGQILIDARLTNDADGPANLVIEWRETGMDAQRQRQEPQFGTLVLERIVPLSVGGTANLAIERDSVRYQLIVPADQFEA